MSTSFKREIRKIKTIFFPLSQKEPAKSSIDLNNRVLVGTHHKTGTVWMKSIFRRICQEFGLKYYSGQQEKMPKDFDVFFQDHSRFDLGKLQIEYRGLHMIRDPRDRIISGCFYHKESREPQLHIKRDEFGGLTYQEKINSYESLDDQIMFEMENSAPYGIRDILNWDYKNPAFFEVKYEDLILDENLILFHKIFVFLGFPGKAIPQILRISYDNSLFSGTLRKSIHIRSGETKQWEKYFKPSHKARFLELFGDALIRLGYESNDDWANR
jgi:hypothetical protein